MPTPVAARIDARYSAQPTDVRDALARFAGLVETWNAKLNLVGVKDAPSLCDVLFEDAIHLADEALVPRAARVLDVGSGAGAPALPFALLRRDVSLTLIEPTQKRVAFLRTAIGALGLEQRVVVRATRVEPGVDVGGPYEVAMSRATFDPGTWLGLGLAHAPRVLVLTGQEPPPDHSGARAAHAVRYALASGSPRTITVYERA